MVTSGPRQWQTTPKSGFTPTGGRFAFAQRRLARCAAMMPKRVVAAVLIAAMVLAGGGVLAGLFF
ncbi:hypothetical protein ACGFMK_08465 [Amycolatopsis sp. NPDC049252]|uniref:hypothetical protein n=1 Tax=Amycolatopsis sp. NPDC049252 TaxID=3363933 RepID=UPI0037206F2A